MAGGTFLFPYEYVKCGSDVVIYGAGNMGTSYVRQLQSTGYCNIVAWVDTDYKHKKNRYMKVVSPEKIKKLKYDRIVVAVSAMKMGYQIIRQLTDMGIKRKRIIYLAGRYFPFEESDITLKDILQDEEKFAELIDDFKKRNYKGLDYFMSLFRDMQHIRKKKDVKKRNKRKKKLFKIVKRYMLSERSPEERTIAFRLLFRLSFDEDCMRLALQTVDDLDDAVKKYWMLVAVGFFEFLYPDTVFEEFYQIKRRMYIDVSEKLLKGVRFSKRIFNTDEGNIVILVQYLHSIDESLTQFVAMYANEMVETDYKIHVIIEEPFLYYDGESDVIPFAGTTKSSYAWRREIAKYMDNRIQIHYAAELPLKERTISSIQDVIDIKPIAVLDMTAKHSFLTTELSKHFPVICVSTGNNCNAAVFHKYICRGLSQCKEMNEIYHSVAENQMVELPPGTVFPDAKYKYKRKDYGLKESDFLLVTVGKRLASEITKELAQEITALLYQHKKMKWLIVGSAIFPFEKKYEDLMKERRIIPWGYEKDLPSLYRICDVYVNPDRIGGGWSVTWAVGCELPVITTDFANDSSPILGDLTIHGDYHDLATEIEKMYVNRDYYKEWKKRTRDLKKASDFGKKIEKLLELCEEVGR